MVIDFKKNRLLDSYLYYNKVQNISKYKHINLLYYKNNIRQISLKKLI